MRTSADSSVAIGAVIEVPLGKRMATGFGIGDTAAFPSRFQAELAWKATSAEAFGLTSMRIADA